MRMMTLLIAKTLLLGTALAGPLLAAPAVPTPPVEAPTALAPHRAVYDLKLAKTRGKAPMQAVRGRILYDLNGSACEGYALSFRQVSELDSGEGKVLFSDLRATTWEEGAGKTLRFHSENRLDQTLRDTTDGQAQQTPDGDGVAIKLTQPVPKSFDLKGPLVFPTEHMKRVIAAAREGKTVLEIGVYDGSEKGEKVYDTLAVIGKRIEPNDRPPTDAAAGNAELAKLARWPATISYFERGKAGGEQTPIYAITFEVYENGVSRGLLLDYNDFVLSGEMTSLELKPAKACP